MRTSVRSVLIAALLNCLILTMAAIGAEDPKATPTPGPSPTPTPPPGCCPPGLHPEPHCNDPKYPHGFMTDLNLYYGPPKITNTTVCVEYNPGMELYVSSNGGDDTDVCIYNDTGDCSGSYDVPEIFTWQGPGHVNPVDQKQFHLKPPAPASYPVTLTADDTGACNVGNEIETASATFFIYSVTLNRPVVEYAGAITVTATFSPGFPPCWPQNLRWVVYTSVGGVDPYIREGGFAITYTPDNPGEHECKLQVWDASWANKLYEKSTHPISWQFLVTAPLVEPANPTSNNGRFSSASPGVLEVHHTASLIPLKVASVDNIVWTTVFTGCERLEFWANLGEGKEDQGAGLNPTLYVYGLPASNAQFGRHNTTVVCTLKPEFGGASRMRTAKYDAFFETSDSNWPGSNNDPNWYYYWKQTCANTGSHVYNPHLSGKFGHADWGCTVFEIGHLIIEQWELPLNIRNLNRTLYELLGCGAGIDQFARTCRHEQRHVQQWQEWEAQHGSGPPPGTSHDDDALSDNYEFASGGSPITFDMNHRNSTVAPGNDFIEDPEIGTEDDQGSDHEDEYVRGPAGEGSWALGSADSEDWSTLGWQWTHY